MNTFEEIETEVGTYICMTDEAGIKWTIPADPANSDYQAYLNKDNPQAALSTPSV
jgi:hypothetical protein